MAVFRSFKALRPAADKARAVAALPYDVVNREEARAIGEKNPLSFLHVDRPEMDLVYPRWCSFTQNTTRPAWGFLRRISLTSLISASVCWFGWL